MFFDLCTCYQFYVLSLSLKSHDQRGASDLITVIQPMASFEHTHLLTRLVDTRIFQFIKTK